MNVAIVGYATEGVVSAAYWHNLGHEITVHDQSTELEIPAEYGRRLGTDYLDGLSSYDLVVRTAGLPPKLILDKNPGLEAKITTSVREFFQVCPTQNIIGVTGTKGKGTTSTLIAKMLEAAGKKVHLGGNIGIAPLEMLNVIKSDDWVVLELSSFQLIDCNRSPSIAVCVMVVPEHLDWHKDIEEYYESKGNLFRFQTADNLAVFNAANDVSTKLASYSPGHKRSYEVTEVGVAPTHKEAAYVDNDTIYFGGKPVCPIASVALLGRHNLENVCAAISAVWDVIEGDTGVIESTVKNFSGLPYRLEFIREVDGVRYYNDSFGTTPETAIAAILALDQPKVVILGGSIKGTDFDSLGNTLAKSTIRQIILIGNTTNPHYKAAAPEIEAALQAHSVTNITSLVKPGGYSMDEIVKAARAAAQSGDAVLLSTGCASFDMFQNYKDRGNQFKQAVQALV